MVLANCKHTQTDVTQVCCISGSGQRDSLWQLLAATYLIFVLLILILFIIFGWTTGLLIFIFFVVLIVTRWKTASIPKLLTLPGFARVSLAAESVVYSLPGCSPGRWPDTVLCLQRKSTSSPSSPSSSSSPWSPSCSPCDRGNAQIRQCQLLHLRVIKNRHTRVHSCRSNSRLPTCEQALRSYKRNAGSAIGGPGS